mmetsp:Transcript_24110/g.27813  ORF Transcript_24110/g.27813 Transcript_24110/m.27813 type:complete len:137 (+) Transcript_24110:957-1367(+)
MVDKSLLNDQLLEILNMRPLRRRIKIDNRNTAMDFTKSFKSSNFRMTMRSDNNPKSNLNLTSSENLLSLKDVNSNDPGGTFDVNNPEQMDALIDTILSSNEYKEFFNDLIINEDLVKYKIERNLYSGQSDSYLKNT